MRCRLRCKTAAALINYGEGLRWRVSTPRQAGAVTLRTSLSTLSHRLGSQSCGGNAAILRSWRGDTAALSRLPNCADGNVLDANDAAELYGWHKRFRARPQQRMLTGGRLEVLAPPRG
jgi:hypothetical protein